MEENKFSFPTEIVDLPSKGLIYPETSPLSSGTVEMKYMTAREEDILTNQSYIQKGTVLDKLLESLIVTKGVNVKDLIVGDKNALFVAARVLGYGKDYSFNYAGEEITVDLSKVENKLFDESQVTKGVNEFSYTLPNSNNKITYKILTGNDETNIDKEIEGLKKINKDFSPELSTRLKYMIKSVEGNTDRGFINKWVYNSFLAKDTKAFRKHVKEMSPDMDLTFQFTSQITGETEALDIPFGINFFYPTA